MKTIATTAFALVLSTSFALAQAGQAQGGASTGRTTNSSANGEAGDELRNEQERKLRNSRPRNDRTRGFRSDRRHVRSQQSLEPHRPSRSRHQQQPGSEQRR
jgi:hypothetical protein